MNLRELSVLIVEDDAFQRQLLARMLTPYVADILQAADGEQGLALLKAAEKVDLVICDLGMPNMDGLEFLRHLGKLPIFPLVVINSAFNNKLLTTARQMAELYGIPMLGVVPKPLSLSVLNELIESYSPPKKLQASKYRAPDFSLEEILRGIENDEFAPYFQPKVEMKSGRLTHAEALARWHHPQHGVVAPGAFIPLLEAHKQLDALTFAMLRKAAQACQEFHANGHLLTISINLSLTSLTAPDLADRITRAVQESGLDPRFIMLEITESAAMTDTGAALENLGRLVMHGFSLSIDDYGTGYSSMQQLARIPFSELKVDQSFVRDFTENDALYIVVESSLDMARKLEIKSVAEGVETAQDWQTLKQIGCDMAQGYYISPPLEKNRFIEFVADFRERFAHLRQRPEGESERIHQVSILIVDDDELCRHLVRRVLTDIGYQNISDVSSVHAALELLARQSFDLLITDLDMPNVNGLQFIKMLRSGKTPAKFDTRIVVLTTYSQPEMLGKALALDASGFMVKPIVPAVIEKKLAEVLEETVKLHPPIAYESINTDLNLLSNASAEAHELAQRSVVNQGIMRDQPDVKAAESAHINLPLSSLRPGMVVGESVLLKNGSLILSVGHQLTEINILRLQDRSEVLAKKYVVVRK